MADHPIKGIDCVGVCVVYFCHDGKGRFVMAKRGPKTRDEHGRWDIGGDGIEFGHTVEATLRKEIKEEYDTDVLGYEFLGFRDVHRTHLGKLTHWIALDFKVRVDSKKVKNNEPEILDEIGWFTLNSFPENVHSQFPHFLKLYRNKLESE